MLTKEAQFWAVRGRLDTRRSDGCKVDIGSNKYLLSGNGWVQRLTPGELDLDLDRTPKVVVVVSSLYIVKKISVRRGFGGKKFYLAHT